MRLEDLQPGDPVTRTIGVPPNTLNMPMTVLKIEDGLIYTTVPEGVTGWKFDMVTGAEVDEDLRWGPQFGRTGSYLRVKS